MKQQALELIEMPVYDEDGNTRAALVAYCPCPRPHGRLFHAFQLKGQDHWHLQCAECGMSYCPQGACNLPEEKS